MLRKIEKDGLYRSAVGSLFQVLYLGRNGQDIDQSMVCYTNLEPQGETPAGEVWMLPETVFLRSFNEVDGWDFDVADPVEGMLHCAYDRVFMYARGHWRWVKGMQVHQVGTQSRSI